MHCYLNNLKRQKNNLSMNPNPNSKTVPILTRPASSNFTNAMLSQKNRENESHNVSPKIGPSKQNRNNSSNKIIGKAPFARSMGIKNDQTMTKSNNQNVKFKFKNDINSNKQKKEVEEGLFTPVLKTGVNQLINRFNDQKDLSAFRPSAFRGSIIPQKYDNQQRMKTDCGVLQPPEYQFESSTIIRKMSNDTSLQLNLNPHPTSTARSEPLVLASFPSRCSPNKNQTTISKTPYSILPINMIQICPELLALYRTQKMEKISEHETLKIYQYSKGRVQIWYEDGTMEVYCRDRDIVLTVWKNGDFKLQDGDKVSYWAQQLQQLDQYYIC